MNIQAIEIARKSLLENHPDFPLPRESYLVLSTPRSGSNLLCTYLEKIEYGKPIEAFSENPNSRKRRNWGIDYSDPYAVIKKAIEVETINNVTGVKFMTTQFLFFLKTARAVLGTEYQDLTDVEITDVFFPGTRYIHLERMKKLKQAISLAKALQNGIWVEKEGEDQSYKEYLLPALYDREHIECCFDLSLISDVNWRHFLTRNQVNYYHIYYEDLASNFVPKMLEIYRFLGIDNNEVVAPALRKQANKESSNWEERFISETTWFTDPRISKPYEEGDLDGLFLERCKLIVQDREQDRWRKMPATRFKGLRSLIFRIKRKLLALVGKRSQA